MKYKGAALLAVGVVLGFFSIIIPITTSGVLPWLLGAVGIVISFFIVVTGVVVLKGPEQIDKLVRKRDELR